jgi:uncharacterized membrane protein YkoI
MTLPVWGDDPRSHAQAGTHPPGCSNISMVQAVNNIESASGARVLDVEIDPSVKPPALFGDLVVYEILTVKDNSFKSYFVDASTGKVLQKRQDWFNYWRLRTLIKPVFPPQANINLAQAIELAENRTGGKPMEVRTKVDGDDIFYYITTRINNKTRRVNIDALTGRVTEIPSD